MTQTLTNLGRVAITPHGTWNEEATYTKLNVVTRAGSSYMAITDVPAGTPVTNTAYWQVVAEKGATSGVGPCADTFDTLTSYSAGDYVTYQEDLYRFTTDHDAGDWDSSEVELVTVGEELNDIRDSYLPLSGGTMTGSINVETDIDTTSSGYHTNGGFGFKDVNDYTFGSIYSQQIPGGEIRTYFQAKRDINSSTVYNGLGLGVAANGTKNIYLDDSSAWRKALGETDWQDFTNSSTFSGTIKYKKWGNLVEVKNVGWIKLASQLNAGASVNLGTIPDGYRGNTTGYCYVGTSTVYIIPIKYESGNITLYNSLSSAISTSTNLLINIVTFI